MASTPAYPYLSMIFRMVAMKRKQWIVKKQRQIKKKIEVRRAWCINVLAITMLPPLTSSQFSSISVLSPRQYQLHGYHAISFTITNITGSTLSRYGSPTKDNYFNPSYDPRRWHRITFIIIRSSASWRLPLFRGRGRGGKERGGYYWRS